MRAHLLRAIERCQFLVRYGRPLGFVLTSSKGSQADSSLKVQRAGKDALRGSGQSGATMSRRTSSRGKLLLESLGFVVRYQAIDQRSELSFHHVGQLVKSKADAVIGDAILREIVGADFFGTVAGFDLSAALGADGGLLFFHFHFVEAGA